MGSFFNKLAGYSPDAVSYTHLELVPIDEAPGMSAGEDVEGIE